MEDDTAQPAEGGRDLVRSLDALLGRVIESGDPIDALRTIRAMGEVASRRARQAANAAAAGAWSWADVGEALGISKQAAHQRLSERLQQRRARLDQVEKEGHDKIDRKFADARDRLAQHPKAATRPGLADRLDEAERKRHDRLSGRLQAAREKIDRQAEREG